jgi:hypothetical protein
VKVLVQLSMGNDSLEAMATESFSSRSVGTWDSNSPDVAERYGAHRPGVKRPTRSCVRRLRGPIKRD